MLTEEVLRAEVTPLPLDDLKAGRRALFGTYWVSQFRCNRVYASMVDLDGHRGQPLRGTRLGPDWPPVIERDFKWPREADPPHDRQTHPQRLPLAILDPSAAMRWATPRLLTGRSGSAPGGESAESSQPRGDPPPRYASGAGGRRAAE